MLAVRRLVRSGHLQVNRRARWASTSTNKDKYKIVVVGGGMYHNLDLSNRTMSKLFPWRYVSGSGGLSVACQISDRFKDVGTPLNKDDIAIVDAADYHYYQASLHFTAA